MKAQASKREQLLQAASQSVLVDGVGHLTLDTVARTAGVSKGGLLYHFPTKEALISGMIERYLHNFEQRMEQARTDDHDQGPGRWLRAFVRTSFSDTPPDLSIAAAGMAALAANPALLQQLREHYQIWRQQATADGITPQTALLVIQATDGVWYGQLFGLAPPDNTARAQLIERLLQLIEENR